MNNEDAPPQTILPIRPPPQMVAGDHNPLLPDGNLLFVGINRSGKSTVMLNMLIRMAYFAIHHIIYFCCPHVSPEDIEKPEHADYKPIQGFPNIRLYWNITGPNSVEEALDHARDNEKHHDKFNLVVLDDWGRQLMSQEFRFFSSRLLNLRHAEKAFAW